MIVKNESKIILRLLQSVVDLIDAYCICDTGSTDDTVNMIETFFREKNIPGKVIVEPFRDFGYNRSFALKACDDIPAEYVLLLDAVFDLSIWSPVTTSTAPPGTSASPSIITSSQFTFLPDAN
jgi:glycosyltransferase involved in cell wall biosynthesis